MMIAADQHAAKPSPYGGVGGPYPGYGLCSAGKGKRGNITSGKQMGGYERSLYVVWRSSTIDSKLFAFAQRGHVVELRLPAHQTLAQQGVVAATVGKGCRVLTVYSSLRR
jgi:hypothetical protein